MFSLDDIGTGLPVGATMQVANSGIDVTSDNGGDFTSGPGYDVFEGIVDAQGVYSYSDAGDVWQINLAGLDPTKRYEVVASTNRDQAATQERWTKVTLLGADASVQAASGGTLVAESPDVVRFQSQNNTIRGDVARWESIDPGSDGEFSLQSNLYLEGTDRSYPPVLLRLREFDAPLPQAPLVPDGSCGGCGVGFGVVGVVVGCGG